VITGITPASRPFKPTFENGSEGANGRAGSRVSYILPPRPPYPRRGVRVVEMGNTAGLSLARCANEKGGSGEDVIYVHRGSFRRLAYTCGVLPQEKGSL